MDVADKLQTNVISSGDIFNLALLSYWMAHLWLTRMVQFVEITGEILLKHLLEGIEAQFT